MTSDLIPLPIWGEALEGDLEALKAAKAELDLPFLIVPVPAVPGSPTRVLALREAPPFLCDWRGVRDPSDHSVLTAAMQWALDPEMYDPKASLIIDQLREIFGPDVTEVPYVPDLDWTSALVAARGRPRPSGET